MSLGSFFVGGSPVYVQGLSGLTFVFETVNFDPPGIALDQLLENQEELSDVGIDKRRWRRINRQFRPFRLQTTSNFSTYASGITSRRQHNQAIGAIGDLNASLYATNYKFKSVKILDCIARLYAGQMVGGGVGASLAVLYTDWSMVLTDDAGNA